MATAPGNGLQAHFGRYTAQLYVVVAVLVAGILFGLLAVNTLSMSDKLSLVAYLKHFVDIESVQPTYSHVLRPALTQNLKLLGILYLLGISVAGMPLVLVAVFFRGFVLGFAADFLVISMHWQGVALGVVTVGLESVFLLPALAIAASVALGFSWELVSPQTRQEAPNLGKSFAFFTGLMVAMGAVTVAGTFVEAFISPFLMHLLGSWGV